MKKVIFDFDTIGNINDFYKIAQQKLELPPDFGNNLDALWDSITGYIQLPVSIDFVNLKMQQLEQFDELIGVFEDALDSFDEAQFDFKYFLRND